MTTITEFILARVADDEEPTFALVPYDCPPDCCAPDGWVGHQCRICGTTEYGGTREAITEIAEEHAKMVHRHGRVLAECAAKRATIAEHADERTIGGGCDHPDTCTLCRPYCRTCWEPVPGETFIVPAVWPCRTLLALAAVYADDSEFRSEWSIQ